MGACMVLPENKGMQLIGDYYMASCSVTKGACRGTHTQAGKCYLHKGMLTLKGWPLCKHLLAASCTPMALVLVLTHLWALSTSSYIYGTICSIMSCTNTDPNPKLKLNVTFDPKGVRKRNASHYGAHLATYEHVFPMYMFHTSRSDHVLTTLSACMYAIRKGTGMWSPCIHGMAFYLHTQGMILNLYYACIIIQCKYYNYFNIVIHTSAK